MFFTPFFLFFFFPFPGQEGEAQRAQQCLYGQGNDGGGDAYPVPEAANQPFGPLWISHVHIPIILFNPARADNATHSDRGKRAIDKPSRPSQSMGVGGEAIRENQRRAQRHPHTPRIENQKSRAPQKQKKKTYLRTLRQRMTNSQLRHIIPLLPQTNKIIIDPGLILAGIIEIKLFGLDVVFGELLVLETGDFFEETLFVARGHAPEDYDAVFEEEGFRDVDRGVEVRGDGAVEWGGGVGGFVGEVGGGVVVGGGGGVEGGFGGGAFEGGFGGVVVVLVVVVVVRIVGGGVVGLTS